MSGFVLRGRAGHVAVRDGRIAAEADGLPVIDAGDLWIGPGFIDSHTHPLSWSRQLAHTSLAHVRSIPEALGALRAAVERTPEGEWLVASEIGEGRNLAEQRLPLRAELDAVSTRHLIFVAGGTLAAVNTPALAAAGLDDPGREIDGGRIELDAAGQPNGVLLGRGAIDLVREIIPRPTFDQDRESLHRYMSMLAARGVTAIADYASVDYVSTFAEDWSVYDAVRRDGKLPVRTRLAYRIPVGTDVDEAIAALRDSGVTPDQGEDELLKAGPLKLFYDGGVQGALLRSEYATRPGYSGLRLLEPSALDRLTRHAAETGWQLSIHVLGGRAIDEVLATWAQVGREVELRGRRFSVQHAFDPSPEDVRICADLGVVVGVQQSLFYMYADNMVRHWGADAPAIGLNPLRTWLDAGVALAGGSDIAPFDPLIALWGMCTRTTEAGNVVGPEQAVTPAEALAIHTAGAAYGMLDEDRIGSLEPGTLADLVLLSDDPAETAPERLRDIEVVGTVVGGRTTFAAPSAPAGLGELRADVSATAEELDRLDAATEAEDLTGGGRALRAAIIIGTLVVIALVLAITEGLSNLGQTTINGLVSGSYIAIGAVGLTIVYGGLRLVNFAHGDYMTFGAYMAVWGRSFGLPLALATLFAVALTAFGSVVLERMLWGPMRRRAPGFFQLVLVGFGLAFIIRYSIQFAAGANQRTLGVDTTKTYRFLGLHIGAMQLLVIVVGAAVIAAVIVLIRSTSFGRQVRALSDSFSLSETTGIDTSRLIVLIWLLSGGLAGLAGVLIAAPIGYITPELGYTIVLSVFAAAVIGAIGNPYGAMLGGLLIGVVEEWSTLVMPAELKPAIGFLAMIVVLVARPQGLFGHPVGADRR